MKKKILMVMPVMKGGGAERVAAQLANEFLQKGNEVQFILTSSYEKEVVRIDLDENIPLMLIQEDANFRKLKGKNKFEKKITSFMCRLFELFGKDVPLKLSYMSFMNEYGREVEFIRKLLERDSSLNVISFLQPSIPIVALASKGLPNKIIFSERGNPERLMKHRYGEKFIREFYKDIWKGVFQTEKAKKTYPKNISEKGVVIYNPLKADLPNVYRGIRRKNITTFCRISEQKNLPLLLNAFSKIYREYPEYKLRIIGDANNAEGERVLEKLKTIITKENLHSAVEISPFNKNVHNEILEDAIYVNSSDYEGMSNAMLEAMAIGMPVICTDCPVGGASAVIKNDINGLLVPVGDIEAMYKAMKKVIDDEEFAAMLGNNASRIRDELSLDNISNKWMELL